MIYGSEQVCIEWHSTGAYCTAKQFSHSSPVKVWGAYCTSVRIVFEILRYSLLQEKTFICRYLHSNNILSVHFNHVMVNQQSIPCS